MQMDLIVGEVLKILTLHLLDNKDFTFLTLLYTYLFHLLSIKPFIMYPKTGCELVFLLDNCHQLIIKQSQTK